MVFCSLTIDRKFRLPREWSNEQLRYISKYFEGSVVNVSGWRDSDKQGSNYRAYFNNADDYAVTNFPQENYRGLQNIEGEIPLDLVKPCPEPLKNRFDVVFNHTTLEHIFDVRRAFRTLCELSRDVVIVVVPFSQEEHESSAFGDYWRFTPSCLRALFEENDFSVVYEVANDHRNAGIYLLFVGSRRPTYWNERLPKYRLQYPVGNRIGYWPGQIHLNRLSRLLARVLRH